MNTADPLARLAELYAQRDALYREIADRVVESDRDVLARFAQELEGAQRNPLRAVNR